MLDDQGDPTAERLIPPRPNLGPEPWPDRSAWANPTGWWGLGLTILLLVGFWRWRRRSKARSSLPVGLDELSIEVEPSPRQRLIDSSEIVRGALIEAFGPAWGSKTTEEIADNPALLERFDPSEVGRLVGLLRVADRVKFAGLEPEADDDWAGWAGSFASRAAGYAGSKGAGKSFERILNHGVVAKPGSPDNPGQGTKAAG